MRALFSALLIFLGTFSLHAQTPVASLSYEIRYGTAGQTIVLEGKSYGPYREVLNSANSTSTTAIVFVVKKKDKILVVSKSGESAALPAGYDPGNLTISDDGAVWTLNAFKPGATEEDPGSVILLVNGTTYGPVQDLSSLEYAETGGGWIATLWVGESQFQVLLNGKAVGTFSGVQRAWMSPDGKFWGYATYDEEGVQTVFTSDKTYKKVSASFFDSLNLREPHWAYSILLDGAEEDLLFVDGKPVAGYINFGGLALTPSGRHFGFQAIKAAKDGDAEMPVVVIDGKEYLGEYLWTNRTGANEYFHWTVTEGTKTTLHTLKMP